MAIIAILMVSNLVHAGNPKNLASKMIDKLDKNVLLTDSQKVALQLKATSFAAKMQNTDSQTSPEEKSASRNHAYQEYKTTLDSILTNDQKAKLVSSQNARRISIKNKYTTSK